MLWVSNTGSDMFKWRYEGRLWKDWHQAGFWRIHRMHADGWIGLAVPSLVTSFIHWRCWLLPDEKARQFPASHTETTLCLSLSVNIHPSLLKESSFKLQSVSLHLVMWSGEGLPVVDNHSLLTGFTDHQSWAFGHLCSWACLGSKCSSLKLWCASFPFPWPPTPHPCIVEARRKKALK